MGTGIDINVQVTGQRKIANLRIVSLDELKKPLLEAIKKSVESNFDRQRAGDDGPEWAPLSKSTIDDRKRKGFGVGPILVRKGALKRAATADLKVKADGSLLSVGISNRKLSKIAAIQQTKRPFFVFSTSLAEAIANIAIEGQKKVVRESLAAD